VLQPYDFAGVNFPAILSVRVSEIQVIHGIFTVSKIEQFPLWHTLTV
jgi:hypothetical protein